MVEYGLIAYLYFAGVFVCYVLAHEDHCSKWALLFSALIWPFVPFMFFAAKVYYDFLDWLEGRSDDLG